VLRFGLCCLFVKEPIRFRRTTARYIGRLSRRDQLAHLAVLCRHNAESLLQALQYCARVGIGAFRVNSQILPLKTHPEVGYGMNDLPGGREVVAGFRACGRFARAHGLRTSFHPDQFILLSSDDAEVVERSKADLAYQTEVAGWIGADVITIHAGGGYGDKPAALRRLAVALRRLPDPVRRRLCLENDDRVYPPADLLPFCRDLGIPLVYDIHHHRCLPDGVSVEKTTAAALSTWDREPVFHVSSPRSEVRGAREHHDYIRPSDVPACWLDLDLTLDVEAKAKELAVIRLIQNLRGL
jgi:UV DNA damage endonuclease